MFFCYFLFLWGGCFCFCLGWVSEKGENSYVVIFNVKEGGAGGGGWGGREEEKKKKEKKNKIYIK